MKGCEFAKIEELMMFQLLHINHIAVNTHWTSIIGRYWSIHILLI